MTKQGVNRMNILPNTRFLTNRIFGRICENLHYEIFKYMNYAELLEIRCLKLGGYELTSNKTLRSRIKNYPHSFEYTFSNFDLEKEAINARKIKLIFTQIGKNKLSLVNIQNNHQKIKYIAKIMKLIPEITELNLCKYICYIYRCIYKYIMI